MMDRLSRPAIFPPLLLFFFFPFLYIHDPFTANRVGARGCLWAAPLPTKSFLCGELLEFDATPLNPH